jgi:protoporphyrinogen oxidase
MSAARKPTKLVVIAGAGPAGLTAALELLRRSDLMPLVFDPDRQVGGISKTVAYRGNRMDLGGHRFFSKSDWVMRWWQEILPVAAEADDCNGTVRISYQGRSRDVIPARPAPAAPDAAASTAVMLVRRRLSRIFYRRRFFDYPLKLNAGTIANMGLLETAKIGLSYARARGFRRTPESSLEDFLINRFGERLYRTFFKDYTEKVWGVPCREISAEWGAQRIKGLSVTKALAHALTSPFRSGSDTAQRRTETSLIERFLYPRLGPGQMWEEVAKRVAALGGEVHLGQRVTGVERSDTQITAVTVRDESTGESRRVACDHFVSTMPVRELTAMLRPDDEAVVRIADRLPYRDFLTAGLLVRRMRTIPDRADTSAMRNGMPPDNWIYIQEPDVKIGRLQVFNNWSLDLVADPTTIWLGLEYFCQESDELWSLADGRLLDFAAGELERIGMLDRVDVLDGTVVRVPKAYPAYFGEYSRFGKIREYLERYPNLYPVGRNGMHRYNNQDHSMLAAKGAVDSILGCGAGKAAIWDINAEDDYHEQGDELGGDRVGR